jgi:manganese-dependent inorganic pyrophosphatase
MYKLYKENEVEIDKTIATLMLSAIISDTLLLKSPTCTEEDRNAVKELAKIAELDYESYGLDMLKAGTDLSSFSIEEILNLDAKQTSLKNVKAIINQVNTASIPEVMKMKADLEAGMNKIIEEKELDLFMLLITDIVNSNSQVIALGKSASLVEKSYGVKLEDNTALLEGVVSRKKQVIPVMTENA